jgi:CRP-like cAMP-binding protein
MPPDRLEFLRSFHPISNEGYELLASKFKLRSFRKGEHIISPGQTQRELYFVKTGVQTIHMETETKTHVLAFTYYPNICAIPGSFSVQMPSKYFFTCMSDSEMECLQYEDLQQIFNDSREIERLFRKINERLLEGMLNQHIQLRTMTISQRFKAFANRSPHLLRQVPHKYIASYLDIDSTNFSKLFNKVKF